MDANASCSYDMDMMALNQKQIFLDKSNSIYILWPQDPSQIRVQPQKQMKLENYKLKNAILLTVSRFISFTQERIYRSHI